VHIYIFLFPLHAPIHHLTLWITSKHEACCLSLLDTLQKTLFFYSVFFMSSKNTTTSTPVLRNMIDDSLTPYQYLLRSPLALYVLAVYFAPEQGTFLRERWYVVFLSILVVAISCLSLAVRNRLLSLESWERLKIWWNQPSPIGPFAALCLAGILAHDIYVRAPLETPIMMVAAWTCALYAITELSCITYPRALALWFFFTSSAAAYWCPLLPIESQSILRLIQYFYSAVAVHCFGLVVEVPIFSLLVRMGRKCALSLAKHPVSWTKFIYHQFVRPLLAPLLYVLYNENQCVTRVFIKTFDSLYFCCDWLIIKPLVNTKNAIDWAFLTIVEPTTLALLRITENCINFVSPILASLGARIQACTILLWSFVCSLWTHVLTLVDAIWHVIRWQWQRFVSCATVMWDVIRWQWQRFVACATVMWDVIRRQWQRFVVCATVMWDVIRRQWQRFVACATVIWTVMARAVRRCVRACVSVMWRVMTSAWRRVYAWGEHVWEMISSPIFRFFEYLEHIFWMVWLEIKLNTMEGIRLSKAAWRPIRPYFWNIVSQCNIGIRFMVQFFTPIFIAFCTYSFLVNRCYLAACGAGSIACLLLGRSIKKYLKDIGALVEDIGFLWFCHIDFCIISCIIGMARSFTQYVILLFDAMKDVAKLVEKYITLTIRNTVRYVLRAGRFASKYAWGVLVTIWRKPYGGLVYSVLSVFCAYVQFHYPVQERLFVPDFFLFSFTLATNALSFASNLSPTSMLGSSIYVINYALNTTVVKLMVHVLAHSKILDEWFASKEFPLIVYVLLVFISQITQAMCSFINASKTESKELAARLGRTASRMIFIISFLIHELGGNTGFTLGFLYGLGCILAILSECESWYATSDRHMRTEHGGASHGEDDEKMGPNTIEPDDCSICLETFETQYSVSISTDWCRTLMMDGRSCGSSMTIDQWRFPIGLSVDQGELFQIRLRKKRITKKRDKHHDNDDDYDDDDDDDNNSYDSGLSITNEHDKDENVVSINKKNYRWVPSPKNHVKRRPNQRINQWFHGWSLSSTAAASNASNEEENEEEEVEIVGAPPYVKTIIKKELLYATVTLCGHTFHSTCLEKWTQQAARPVCPLCRETLKRSMSQMFF